MQPSMDNHSVVSVIVFSYRRPLLMTNEGEAAAREGVSTWRMRYAAAPPLPLVT